MSKCQLNVAEQILEDSLIKNITKWVKEAKDTLNFTNSDSTIYSNQQVKDIKDFFNQKLQDEYSNYQTIIDELDINILDEELNNLTVNLQYSYELVRHIHSKATNKKSSINSRNEEMVNIDAIEQEINEIFKTGGRKVLDTFEQRQFKKLKEIKDKRKFNSYEKQRFEELEAIVKSPENQFNEYIKEGITKLQKGIAASNLRNLFEESSILGKQKIEAELNGMANRLKSVINSEDFTIKAQAFSSYLLDAYHKIEIYADFTDKLNQDDSEVYLSKLIGIRDFVNSYKSIFDEINKFTENNTDNPMSILVSNTLDQIGKINALYNESILEIEVKLLGDTLENEALNQRQTREKLKQINSWKKEIAIAEKNGHSVRVAKLKQNIEKQEEILEKNKNLYKQIREVFQGKDGDVGAIRSWLMSLRTNPDLILSGISNFIKKVLDKINDKGISMMLEYDKEWETFKDQYKKEYGGSLSTFNLEKMLEKYSYVREEYYYEPADHLEENSTEENRTKSIKTRKRLDFLHDVDSKFYEEREKLEAESTFWGKEHRLREPGSEAWKYAIKQSELAEKAKFEWYLDNQESEFTEIYQAPKKTRAESFAKLRDQMLAEEDSNAFLPILEQIKELNKEISNTYSSLRQLKTFKVPHGVVQEKLVELRNKKYKLSSRTRQRSILSGLTKGTKEYKKQEYKVKVAEILTDFTLAMNQREVHIVDSQSWDNYNADLKKLKELRDNKEITLDEYESILKGLSRFTFDAEWEKEKSELETTKKAALEKIYSKAQLPVNIDLENLLERRRDLVKPVRDINGTIDGSALSLDQQREITDLDELISTENDKLINILILKSGKKEAYDNLVKEFEGEFLKEERKLFIDNILEGFGIKEEYYTYKKTTSELYELSDSIETKYYKIEYNKELLKFMDSPKESFYSGGKNYSLKDGVWTQGQNNIPTKTELLLAYAKSGNTEEAFQKSEWYKANHYLLPDSETYVKSYHWKVQTPASNKVLSKDAYEKYLFDSEQQETEGKNGFYFETNKYLYTREKKRSNKGEYWLYRRKRKGELKPERIPSKKYQTKEIREYLLGHEGDPQYKLKNNNSKDLMTDRAKALSHRKSNDWRNLKDFEKTFLKFLLSKQEEAQGKYSKINAAQKLGYRVPTVERKRGWDSWTTKEGVNPKNKFHQFMRDITTAETDIDEGSGGPNRFNLSESSTVDRSIRTLPHYFSSRIEDQYGGEGIDLQSRNIYNAVFSYAFMAEKNSTLNNEVVPHVIAQRDIMRNPANTVHNGKKDKTWHKISRQSGNYLASKLGIKNLGFGDIKEDSDTSVRLKRFDEYVDMLVYGRTVDPEGNTIRVFGKPFRVDKIIKKLRGIQSFQVMSAIPWSMYAATREASNATNAHYQMIINSLNKDGLVNWRYRDFLESHKEILKNEEYGRGIFADYIKGRTANKSKMGKFIDHFNLFEGKLTSTFGETVTSQSHLRKLLSTDILFWQKNSTEMILYTATLLTYLRSNFVTKVNEDGSKTKISLEEAFEERDGLLYLPENITHELINENGEAYFAPVDMGNLRSEIQVILNKTQGNYNAYGSELAKRTWYGSGLLWMKGFFGEFLMQRFFTSEYSPLEKTIVEGYYVTLVKTLWEVVQDPRAWIGLSGEKQVGWSELTPDEQSAIKKASLDFLVVTVGWLMISVLFGFDDDDPNKYKKMNRRWDGIDWSLYYVMKASSEVKTFTPFGGLDFLREVKKNILNPLDNNAIPLYTDFVNIMDHIWGFDRTTRKQYGYDKGTLKLLIDFHKMIGFTKATKRGKGGLGSPEETIKNYLAAKKR